MEDYVEWHETREEMIDYSSYSRDATPETLAAVGWSENLKMLSYDWFFMDDRLNADAFRTVTEQVERDTRLSIRESYNPLSTCVWISSTAANGSGAV